MITQAIDQHLAAAEKLIWFAIEREVKAVLQDPNNPAVCFISAMGTWFWSNDEDTYPDNDEKYPWQAPINAIYNRYNDLFKMYGEGVRWDLVDGKVIKTTDW